MFDFNPGVIALLIPIIAIIGGSALAIVGVITKSREEELKHKERIVAMEKGMPVPELPKTEEHRPQYLKHRMWGLVLTFVGAAILIGRIVTDDLEHGVWWGAIPLAIGIALLIAGALERRDLEKK